MESFEVIVIAVGVALLAWAYLLTIAHSRVDVDPGEAVIIRNNSSDELRVLLGGAHFPGPTWTRFRVVTLRNETSQRHVASVISRDSLKLNVTYSIHKFQVKPLPEEIIKAITQIDYEKRHEAASAQIAAILARVLGGVTAGKLSADKVTLERRDIDEIEAQVNRELIERVETPWGIELRIEIAFVGLPGRLYEATAALVSADPEGEAIRKKSAAAGVSPSLVTLSETAREIIRKR